jgi:hypothetical protein
MTAVEWLEDQIKNSKYYFKLMAEINSRSTVSQSNIFEQAKEMEKEQKAENWQLGYDACEFHNDYDELQKEPIKNPYRNKK